MENEMELFEEVRVFVAGVVNTCDGCRWRGETCRTCSASRAKEILEKLDGMKWKRGIEKFGKREYVGLGAPKRGRPESLDMTNACAEVMVMGALKRVITRADVKEAICKVGARVESKDVTKSLCRKGMMLKIYAGKFECISFGVKAKSKSNEQPKQGDE